MDHLIRMILDRHMPLLSIRTLTLVTAAGAATTGGALFAFSTFVMPGLRRLTASEGIVAMNAINRAAPSSPLFMTALLGTAAASIGLGAVAINRHDHPSSTYVLIGAALYLVGIAVTAAYHVPRNDALLLVDPSGPGAAATWRRYAHGWTLWNHVRAATSLAGAAMYVLAVRAD